MDVGDMVVISRVPDPLLQILSPYASNQQNASFLLEIFCNDP